MRRRRKRCVRDFRMTTSFLRRRARSARRCFPRRNFPARFGALSRAFRRAARRTFRLLRSASDVGDLAARCLFDVILACAFRVAAPRFTTLRLAGAVRRVPRRLKVLRVALRIRRVAGRLTILRLTAVPLRRADGRLTDLRLAALRRRTEGRLAAPRRVALLPRLARRPAARPLALL